MASAITSKIESSSSLRVIEPCFPPCSPMKIIFHKFSTFIIGTVDVCKEELLASSIPAHLIETGETENDMFGRHKYLTISKIAFKEMEAFDCGFSRKFKAYIYDKEDPLIDLLCETAKKDFEHTEPVKSYSLATKTPLKALPKKILLEDHADGFCLGELHDQIEPKTYLIDQMQELKKLGVTTLFLEHFLYDTHMQELLDEYVQSEKDEFPPLLNRYLEKLKSDNFDYSGVIRSAKLAGIRIVGIDTSISYEAGYSSFGGSSGPKRFFAMNYVANKIIRHEKGSGKFVALMGFYHGSRVIDIREGGKTPAPGVADLLGVPFVVIEKGRVDTGQKNLCNVSKHKDAIEHIDYLYQV